MTLFSNAAICYMLVAAMRGKTMKRLLTAIALMFLLTPLAALAQETTLRDARVGEWAVYSTSKGKMQERHQVVSRRRDVVVVRIENIINGRTISQKTIDYQVNRPRFLRDANGEETVNAGGRSYTAIVVRKGNRVHYYSNDVPVTGLVAIHSDGEVIKELMNFGY
jgi:hypothetical protein